MEPILEQYEVVRLLGSGGMARVWQVRHRAFGTLHAVKVLQDRTPRLAARLRTEGQLTRSLQHPNVVRVTDVIDTALGEPALVMELVDGPTLAELLGAGRPLTMAEIDALGRGILAGVAAAHARSWVHRDLKPGNVLLARTEDSLIAKVADFGLIKALDDDGAALAGSTTRHGMGTRRYMSLEQLSGEPADKKMDVFSLGAVLFELIEGTPAFPTLSAWSQAIRQGRVPPLARADVPERLQRTVAAALSPCAERPEDAAALLSSWEGGVALAGPFRAELVRQAAWIAAHLEPQRLRQPLTQAEEEHVSVCARCRADVLRNREVSIPSTVFPGPAPAEASTLLGLQWVGALGSDRPWLEELVQELRREHHGRAMAPEGVTFDAPADGLAFAVALHRALRARCMALERSVSARSALHVGEAELVMRLARLARPEQTLCSREAADALGRAVRTPREAAGEGPLLVLHGSWRFLGQATPVELFEVGAQGEAPMVPPPDGREAWRVVLQAGVWVPARPVRHNLPPERDRFVGREVELSVLAERVQGGERLVAVHGAAGIGKTRLALHYAWTWLGAFSGGASFCDLSEARSADGIVYAVASALEVPLGREDPIVQLGHALAGRGRCLVVLDNFEQVAEHAAATLGHWVSRATEAVFLVTSRAVLGVGEQVHRLEPLEVDSGVALFVERATMARRDFDARQEEGPVRELVELLDGLPLAIELCAARVRTMPPSQLRARMGERFRLLAGGEGRPERQETLRAALDWSYELLKPWEQAALLQLSVFEGGFTLEAAEAVVDVSRFPEAPWVADLVQSLVDRALLRVVGDDRFGMLVSVHQYAVEKLHPEGGREVQERHGRFFAAFGTDEALEALSRRGGEEKRRALARELDNLVAASRRAGDADTVLAACAVLELRGPFAMGIALLEAVKRSEGRRGRLLWTAGRARQLSGKINEARACYEAALTVAREAGDRRDEAIVLDSLGSLHRIQGRMDEVRVHHEAALAIYREVGDRGGEGLALGNLGTLHREQGRPDEARAHYEAALAVAREVGDRRNEGNLIANLGVQHLEEGRVDEARAHCEAALAVHRDVGNRRNEGIVLSNLGGLHAGQGRPDEARAHYEAALAIYREVGDRQAEAPLLGNLGLLHARQGRMDEARAHYEAALAVARAVGSRRTEGQVLATLGMLHARQGSADAAWACFDAGERLLRELSDTIELAKLLTERAIAEQRVGAPDRAHAALREAIRLTPSSAGPDSDLGRGLARARAFLQGAG